MKNDGNRNFLKFLKPIENINVSFSISHSIDFWSRKNGMPEKQILKSRKLNFEKMLRIATFEDSKDTYWIKNTK